MHFKYLSQCMAYNKYAINVHSNNSLLLFSIGKTFLEYDIHFYLKIT